jgi:replicative DNA helicase
MEKEKKIVEKVTPQSIEAEQSLLGCLLIDKDAIIKIADNIFEGDFYRDAHKISYFS